MVNPDELTVSEKSTRRPLMIDPGHFVSQNWVPGAWKFQNIQFQAHFHAKNQVSRAQIDS